MHVPKSRKVKAKREHLLLLYFTLQNNRQASFSAAETISHDLSPRLCDSQVSNHSVSIYGTFLFPSTHIFIVQPPLFTITDLGTDKVAQKHCVSKNTTAGQQSRKRGPSTGHGDRPKDRPKAAKRNAYPSAFILSSKAVGK